MPKDIVENMRFRMFVWRWAAESRERQLWLKEVCRRDLLFWVNVFCWTHDPRGSGPSELPFVTYGFQDDALLEIQDAIRGERDLAMPKSREQGASWMILVVFDHAFLFESSKSFMVASRNMDLVDKTGDPDCLFWKFDFLHDRMPLWMASNKTLARTSGNIYNSETGSVISGASKTSEIGRGGRRTAIMLDEFAAFRAKESFAVLSATFSTAKCRILNSTPKGVGNAFDDQVNGSKGCQVLRLHWSQHPVQSRGLYRSDEDQNLELMDREFWDRATVRWLRRHCDRVAFHIGPSVDDNALARDHYPFRLDGCVRSPYRDNEGYRLGTDSLIAQELEIDFLASGRPFFDSETVEGWIKEMARAPDLVGEVRLEERADELVVERFDRVANGRFKLWDYVESPPQDRQYIIGCDVSAGTGASNSCISIVDVTSGEKVAAFSDAHINSNRLAENVAALGRRYNEAMVIWEAQGPGLIFGWKLKELGYSRFYYHYRKNKNVRSNQPGWYSTGEGKQTLLDLYRQVLIDKKFINRDEESLRECTEYRWDSGKVVHQSDIVGIDPSDVKTQHGDKVIADALCALGIKYLEGEKKEAPPSPPPGTFGHRRLQRRAELKHERSGRWRSMRLKRKAARWRAVA